MKKLPSILFLTMAMTFAATLAFAVPLDLESFTADPGVTPSGNSATFQEDLDFTAWYLFDDNFFVDPNATILSFNYSLDLGVDDFGDYFLFELNFAEALYVDATGAGYFEIDLSPYQGSEISLAWSLQWGGWDDVAGTFASISNVDLAMAPAAVPEPATILLLGGGLLGLLGLRRRAG